MVVIRCALFVTSQFDVIFMFPNQRFGKVRSMVNGQWFVVSYDSTNKQKHHKSHRMQ